MSKKLLVVPMPLAQHTKIKWHARQEGLSMARVARALFRGWLAGDFDVAPYLYADHTKVGRPTQVGDDEPDFYDALYEKVSQAVES